MRHAKQDSPVRTVAIHLVPSTMSYCIISGFNVVNSRVVRNITVFTKEMEQYNCVDFEVLDSCGIRNIEETC